MRGNVHVRFGGRKRGNGAGVIRSPRPLPTRHRPDELYREGVTPPLLDLRDAYARLAQQPDLISRIARVTAVSASDRSVGPPAPSTAVGGASTPHSGNGLFPISASPSGVPTGAERDRLDELAAHVSGDVSWCTRIPAGVLDPGNAREPGRPSLFQRDRCILEIASNTRRPESCRLIPERPDDWSGAMSRRSVCEFQAARPPDPYHYGAPPPSSDPRSARSLSCSAIRCPTFATFPPTRSRLTISNSSGSSPLARSPAAPEPYLTVAPQFAAKPRPTMRP